MVKNSSYVALGLLVATLFVIPACDWLQRADTQEIEKPMLRIIDVNMPEVYSDAHIESAVHVNLDELESASKTWNKEDSLIVYCSDYKCRTSHSAARALRDLGFKDVAVYAGGISEWYKLSRENNERYPFVGAGTMPFLQKETEKVIPEKEELKIVSADDVALQIEKKRGMGLAA